MESEIIEGLNAYLSFQLGDEKFAVNIGHVKKILEMTNITRVPHVPEFYKGVINLFGEVLPVIDARLKFGMEEKSYDQDTCMIVLMLTNQGKTNAVGIVVDQVHKVINIPSNQIKEPPEIGGKFKNELIQSIAQIDDHFIILLNVDKLFTTSELNVINPMEN
ncbi:MAG TPA: chemotaxis protein CheW [Sunxiuqinia sp.]|nr:chemotaxis protein CheW [Sunxiuqinia sp.]